MTCSCCHAATFPSQGSPAGRASVSTTPNSGSRPRCSPFCSEMSVQLEGTACAGGSPGLRVRAGRRAWGQVLGAGPWRWAGFTPTYLLLSHSGHRDPRSAQASGRCSVLSCSVQPQPGAADPPARGSMTPPLPHLPPTSQACFSRLSRQICFLCLDISGLTPSCLLAISGSSLAQHAKTKLDFLIYMKWPLFWFVVILGAFLFTTHIKAVIQSCWIYLGNMSRIRLPPLQYPRQNVAITL